MNSIAKKWQEMANERLMLMQKLSAQHDEIAKLKKLMLEALDFLDSGETYRDQYYNEMFGLIHKLREAAK